LGGRSREEARQAQSVPCGQLMNLNLHEIENQTQLQCPRATEEQDICTTTNNALVFQRENVKVLGLQKDRVSVSKHGNVFKGRCLAPRQT